MPAALALTTNAPPEKPVKAAISNLVERARSEAGRQPLDEHRWSQLGVDPGQRLVIAEDDTVFGFALITRLGSEWNIDLVVDPDRHGEREPIAKLVERAKAEVAALGGGHTQMWVHEATDTDAGAATKAGFTDRRDLHQLRVPLPLQATADPIQTRAFEVGRDEAAWLEVNAAAFAGHRDQGQWTLDDLIARQSEPWFDTEGFLLHEIDQGEGPRLAGFNWTKVHGNPSGSMELFGRASQHPGIEAGNPSGSTETLGEIYVIGVHPDFVGRGLGRRLCVAGLHHLATKTSTGMLYVDADNGPAMGLYLGLGFTVDHTNTAFSGHVDG